MHRMRNTIALATAVAAISLPASAFAVTGNQNVTANVLDSSIAIAQPAAVAFSDELIPGANVLSTGTVQVLSTTCYNLAVADQTGNAGKMRRIVGTGGNEYLETPLKWRLTKIDLASQSNSFANMGATFSSVAATQNLTHLYTVEYNQIVTSADILDGSAQYGTTATYQATAC